MATGRQERVDRGDAAGSALARASDEVAARLAGRGVRLTGRETSDELIDLLDAVERFEGAAERLGADLLVDEPVHGTGAPIQPDDPMFVLPRRDERERAADFRTRIAAAAARLEHTRRRARGAR